MPKATVTIDLPDGWELADTEMRPAKRGEWKWDPSMREPIECSGNTIAPWIIVRRIAEQYVNVRLRREDAKWVAETWPEKFRNNYSGASLWEVAAACREALSERCGATYRKYFDRELDLSDCLLPAGHAGEHGV